MSEPIKTEDPSYGAQLEIMSAMSSLHMYPRFKKGYCQHTEKFLSEIEENASHSMLHLRAALHYTQTISDARESLKDALMHTFLVPNLDQARKFFLPVCKAFGLNTGLIGVIDPGDPRTFYYIDECNHSVGNAWNLWIQQLWMEEHQMEPDYTWLYEED